MVEAQHCNRVAVGDLLLCPHQQQAVAVGTLDGRDAHSTTSKSNMPCMPDQQDGAASRQLPWVPLPHLSCFRQECCQPCRSSLLTRPLLILPLSHNILKATHAQQLQQTLPCPC